MSIRLKYSLVLRKLKALKNKQGNEDDNYRRVIERLAQAVESRHHRYITHKMYKFLEQHFNQGF